MGWRYVCQKCGKKGPVRANPNDADDLGDSHQDAYGVTHRYNVMEV